MAELAFADGAEIALTGSRFRQGSLMTSLVRRFALALTFLGLGSLLASTVWAQPPVYFTQWTTGGWPWAVAADGDGFVYVTDLTYNRVLKYTTSGSYAGQWGSQGSGNGQFNVPNGVATDAFGNVYVADTGNNRIQKFTSTGTFLTKWGGVADPRGIATDAAGNVYVAERGNSRIHKFTSTGTHITVWGSSGTGNGQFTWPQALATDPAGNVYVTDFNPAWDPNTGISNPQRVQKFTSTGTYLTQWGVGGTGPGQLYIPQGLATDGAGNVYVSDAVNRVQMFTGTGTFLGQWGSEGTGNGQFESPIGVATDPFGNVYVVDSNNGRIQKFGQAPEVDAVFLDASKPEWLDTQHHLLSNPPGLSTGGTPVVGATADGATQIVLRLTMGSTPTVTLSLADAGNSSVVGLGSLSGLGAPSGGTSISVTNQGGFGYAVYTAPLDFVRSDVPADANAVSRTITVHGVRAPSNTLQIVRPPVVFCHGLWSGPGTWTFLQVLADPRWETARVDYQAENGAHLSVNVGSVAKSVGDARDNMRINHLACAQVDYVGHSMGGLLGRLHAGSTVYRNDDNLGQGDFHKFITLDTPYLGAKLANKIVWMRDVADNTMNRPAIRTLCTKILMGVGSAFGVGYPAVTAGAVDDLSEGSPALNLPSMTVPTHAHVGTGGSDIVGTVTDLATIADELIKNPFAKPFLSLVELAGESIDFFYEGNEHDFVVSKTSQEGGLTGDAVTYTGFLNGIHGGPLGVTTSFVVGQTVESLLQASVNSASFAPGFSQGVRPQASSTSMSRGVLGGAATTDLVDGGLGIRFDEPAQGASVHPGDEVLVRIAPIGGQPLGRVEVDAGPGGLFLTGPDFADTLHIPADAIGPLQLDAFGLLADGSFAVGQPIVLNVTPAATLQGLQISPGRIGFARLGEEAAPNVLASYSDGISRDVTRLPGLAWTSSNPAIAAIGQSGRVVATGAGRAWITASYAGYVAGDSVVSAGGPRTNTPPRAVIGGPYFARPGAGVCLDGSQSTDPDLYFGDHLHFAWDLTGNGQFADGRASVACTIAGTAGNHPVALRVVDDAGDSSVTRTILTVSESVEVTAVPMPFSAVPTFAIRVLTNPAAREVMHISYSVPERASAMISVYDIAGRRVVQHQIDDVGPGVHAIDLRPRAGFTAGVYLVQLRQGASRAWARAIVVR